MIKKETCLRCQSTDIVHDIRVIDKGDHHSIRNLEVQVQENPDALFFKGTTSAAVRANVCADCGFLIFEVSKSDARNLKNAKRKQK